MSVSVRIVEPALRVSFASFLSYSTPVGVTETPDGLEISFEAALSVRQELRLVERLLWAWRIERAVRASTAITLTASDGRSQLHASSDL